MKAKDGPATPGNRSNWTEWERGRGRGGGMEEAARSPLGGGCGSGGNGGGGGMQARGRRRGIWCSGTSQAVSALPLEDEVLFNVNSQFRVRAVLSGGTKTLLATAMEADLTRVDVYELEELDLRTYGGIYEVTRGRGHVGHMITPDHKLASLRPK